MGIHSCPQRLETPTTFACSDLQLIVSGSSVFPECLVPSPRVRVSDPPLGPTTNAINPQCLKRPVPNPNEDSNPTIRRKINDSEEEENDDEDSEEQHEEDNDEEEEEEEEVSCSSSSSVKNNKKKEEDRKFAAVGMASVKRLLETMVEQQHRFFMDLLETLEKNEQHRERIRADKEDKWRAEERAHRQLIENSMLLLTQTLLRGRFPKEEKMVLIKKRSQNWKRGEVLQLIQMKGEMDQRFCNSSRRGVVWDELSGALSARGVRRDGKQCREKWDKLMASYKDVVDGKRDRDDVPHFSELHRILVGFRSDESNFDCLA